VQSGVGRKAEHSRVIQLSDILRPARKKGDLPSQASEGFQVGFCFFTLPLFFFFFFFLPFMKNFI
jgi:hypothetical protein